MPVVQQPTGKVEGDAKKQPSVEPKQEQHNKLRWLFFGFELQYCGDKNVFKV